MAGLHLTVVTAERALLDESGIVATAQPHDAVLVERTEWGNLYGYVKEVRRREAVPLRRW